MHDLSRDSCPVLPCRNQGKTLGCAADHGLILQHPRDKYCVTLGCAPSFRGRLGSFYPTRMRGGDTRSDRLSAPPQPKIGTLTMKKTLVALAALSAAAGAFAQKRLRALFC